MRRHWPLAAALLLAEVARITFWAVTGRRYEDALITLTHAENAARGLGSITTRRKATYRASRRRFRH